MQVKKWRTFLRDWRSGPDSCNGIFFTSFGTMAINLGGSNLFLHVDLVDVVVVVKLEFLKGRPSFLFCPVEILFWRRFVHFCFGEVVENWGWVHFASTACRILKFPVSVPTTTTVCPGHTSFLTEKVKYILQWGLKYWTFRFWALHALQIWTFWKSNF